MASEASVYTLIHHVLLLYIVARMLEACLPFPPVCRGGNIHQVFRVPAAGGPVSPAGHWHVPPPRRPQTLSCWKTGGRAGGGGVSKHTGGGYYVMLRKPQHEHWNLWNILGTPTCGGSLLKTIYKYN